MSVPRWVNVSDNVEVLIGAGAGARIERLGPTRYEWCLMWPAVDAMWEHGYHLAASSMIDARVAAERALHLDGVLTAHDLARLEATR